MGDDGTAGPSSGHVGPPCELVRKKSGPRDRPTANPGRAQSMSTAVQTRDGIVFRPPVPGHAPSKVFWTPAGPRVEAVFPHH
jgi:hypothetical protein